MLKYLYKAKNKSGFTLVEMVIVIAIIAIMSAVAVPNFVASQRRAEANKFNEQARGFYFAVQNTLLNTMENDNTDMELYLTIPIGGVTMRRSTPFVENDGTTIQEPIVKVLGPSGTNENFFIYAVTDVAGNITSAELSVGGSAPPATPNVATYPSASPSTNDETFKGLIEEIQGYLAAEGKTGKDKNQGYYYAMFDANFRVTMAYFSLHMNKTEVGSGSFSKKNTINGRTFGAHPMQYAFSDSFKMPGSDVSIAPNLTWYMPLELGGAPI